MQSLHLSLSRHQCAQGRKRTQRALPQSAGDENWGNLQFFASVTHFASRSSRVQLFWFRNLGRSVHNWKIKIHEALASPDLWLFDRKHNSRWVAIHPHFSNPCVGNFSVAYWAGSWKMVQNQCVNIDYAIFSDLDHGMDDARASHIGFPTLSFVRIYANVIFCLVSLVWQSHVSIKYFYDHAWGWWLSVILLIFTPSIVSSAWNWFHAG